MSVVDQLRQKLNMENEDTRRFDLLIELGWEIAARDVEEMRKCLSEAKSIMEKSDENDKDSGEMGLKVKVLEAFNCVRNDDFSTALSLCKTAYDDLDGRTDPDGLMGRVRAMRVLGLIYGYLGRFEDCLSINQAGLLLMREFDLKVTEEEGTPLSFLFLNNIATVYTFTGRNEDAIEYYHEALALTDTAGMTAKILILNNLGMTYIDVGQVDLAESCISQSLELTLEHHLGAEHLQQCYQGFGKLHQAKGQYAESIVNYDVALKLARDNHIRFTYLDILIEIGRLMVTLSYYDQALEYVGEALEIAEDMKTDNLVAESHRLLALSFEGLGKATQALDHYKLFMQYRENVATLELEIKLGAFSAEYRLDQARQEAQLHKVRAQTIEEAHRNLTVLSKIGREITATLDIDLVMTRIYEYLNDLMHLNAFGIGLYNDQDNTLEYKMLIEDGERQPSMVVSLNEIKGFAAKCLETKEAVLIQDLEQVVPEAYLATKNTPDEAYSQTGIFQPLIVEDRVIGLVTVQSHLGEPYTDQEQDVIRILATYVAIAINNSRQSDALKAAIAELEITSITDPLTGLYNRRFMMRQLELHVQRYARNGSPFSIIICDIDYFKQINDTYGHDCGDRVLIDVARVLQGMVRAEDCVARWGGEEFFLLLPQTTGDIALSIAQRLRILINNYDHNPTVNGLGDTGDGSGPNERPCFTGEIKVSMTYGIATYGSNMTLEEVIKRADRSLYKGKNSGRNCCVLYGDQDRGLL